MHMIHKDELLAIAKQILEKERAIEAAKGELEFLHNRLDELIGAARAPQNTTQNSKSIPEQIMEFARARAGMRFSFVYLAQQLKHIGESSLRSAVKRLLEKELLDSPARAHYRLVVKNEEAIEDHS